MASSNARSRYDATDDTRPSCDAHVQHRLRRRTSRAAIAAGFTGAAVRDLGRRPEHIPRDGAEASDQEFEQILAYLARHFSPIRVNKANANDLAATLDVPTSVAEAIVAYRLEKSEFKTVDDLKNVPGLESGKIEAQKGRIVF